MTKHFEARPNTIEIYFGKLKLFVKLVPALSR